MTATKLFDVCTRSLVLLGIAGFAAVAAGGKMLAYAAGGPTPDLVLGPILVCSVVTVVLRLWPTWQYHDAWNTTGRTSDILATERRGALIDALLTAATGMALLASPLLGGTWAHGLMPIVDALPVMLPATIMLPQSLATFRAAVRELAGGSAGGDAEVIAGDVIARVLAGAPFRCLDISAMKLGRTHFVVVYVDGDNHNQLRTQLGDVLAACSFARGLKTPNGLTPCECICVIRPSEPDRCILRPIRQLPGPNAWRAQCRSGKPARSRHAASASGRSKSCWKTCRMPS